MSRSFLFLALALLWGGCREMKTSFVFNEDERGVMLRENGQAVFFYQRESKSRDSQYVCSNYIHPLYSLSGDTLTEEFPEDHPYHRGIFWAWHQLYIDDQPVGDGWVMENFSQQVTGLETEVKKEAARMTTYVDWKSPLWQNGEPFVQEKTVISVHSLSGDVRKIDFEISLKALARGVSIGGSDDEKGYGGFCARVRTPEDMIFTSDGEKIIPQNLQIKAGPWMDFSATFGEGHQDGLTILCHPDTPNYPAPWILRQSASMQNIVFPGRERIHLPTDIPLVLRYRLLVHKGSPEDIDIKRLQTEYGSD